jgi:hypothetical protein
VTRLISKNTVEERIVKRAQQKQSVQQTVYSGEAFKADVFKPHEVMDLLFDDDDELKQTSRFMKNTDLGKRKSRFTSPQRRKKTETRSTMSSTKRSPRITTKSRSSTTCLRKQTKTINFTLLVTANYPDFLARIERLFHAISAKWLVLGSILQFYCNFANRVISQHDLGQEKFLKIHLNTFSFHNGLTFENFRVPIERELNQVPST